MAWRIAVVTEDGTEKLEMSPDVLKEFIIKCARIAHCNGSGDEVFIPEIIRAIEGGFKMADDYLRRETVKLP